MQDDIRVLDLFCGCGGLGSGFTPELGFKVFLAVDSWDKAILVHTRNFKGVDTACADLRAPSLRQRITREFAGEIDLIVGGPPCQPFSTLGSRSDVDQRASLVDVFCQYVLALQPSMALMENVRGFASKSAASGELFPAHVRQTFGRRKRGKIGYAIADGFIDLGGFGLAQSRPRWITLFVRDDLGDEATVSGLLGQLRALANVPMLTVRDAISDLPRVRPGGGSEESMGRTGPIFNHQSLNHSAALIERLSHVPKAGGLKDVPRRLLTEHLCRLLDGKYGSGGHVKNVYGRLDWDKPSGTVVAGIDKITCGRFVHPREHRLLTPRECARLQSFADQFRFLPSLVNSYYLIGNAVPPAAAKFFAKVARSFFDQNGNKASRKTIMSAR